ncbi:MAG: ASPIC/UnbV domain-containing protein [Planctomycetes bacterium]|nr:ASPIC/UnbV domain-containing protein [Planctomycetota bacterium]
MSLSPETDADDANYKNGWQQINNLISQGKSWSGNEPNCMFLNIGGGKFADASAVSGLDFKDDGRSAVAHDYDLDGDVDLIITNRSGPRVRVMQNNLSSSNHYLQLKLVGATNSDAIGARIEIHLNNEQQTVLTQTRRAGSGYQAQTSAWMHFGLGKSAVSKIIVKWPNGSSQIFDGDNIKVNNSRQRYVISQNKSLSLAPMTSVEKQFVLSTDVVSEKQPYARIVLPHPIPMPTLTAIMPGERQVTMFGTGRFAALSSPQTKATLLNLWSETCAPCIKELSDIIDHQQQFMDANVVPIALNVSSNKIPPNFTAPAAQATAACINILDIMQRTIMRRDIALPTPSSFLIDSRGSLVAIYLGAVDIEVLLEDFKLLNMSDEQRLSAAVPFAGQWFNGPPKPSLLPLEHAFTTNDLPSTAREFQTGYIYLQMARAFSETNRNDLAIRYFELALEAGPYFFEAYSGLGYAKQISGDNRGAIIAYETALALSPNDKAVKTNLEKARAALND